MVARQIIKPLSKEKIEELADSIYKLFARHQMWSDTFIYFNGCRIGNKDPSGTYCYDGKAYMEEGKDPRDYFEYVNPEHILSMSFEGPVYHMFNYGTNKAVLKKFNALLERYGVYYELGNAWNLSCYYV